MINSKGQIPNQDHYTMFAIKNALEGCFCMPFQFRGPKAFVLAVRSFRHALSQLGPDSAIRPSDLSLYVVGEFDPFSGRVNGYDAPVDASLLEEVPE